MYKNIELVNSKKRVLFKVKVNITSNMFLFIPEVIDSRLTYINNKLLNIRKQLMKEYLDNISHINGFENIIINITENLLLEEISKIKENEDIMLYLVKS